MNALDKVAGLDLPNIGREEKISRLLSSALGSEFDITQKRTEERGEFFWDAKYFNLDRVEVFQNATQEEKREILRLCSQGLLAETYLVEKAGVGYMAKMTLLAESTEERMIYALFSADEATHLAQISQFAPQMESPSNPFSQFLANFLETKDKVALLFVIQVILEGWGLTHYRSLAKNCLDTNLTQIYTGFLQAEARHHGMGLTYFHSNSVGECQPFIAESVSIFLRLVQSGPVSIVNAIQQVKGNLSTLELGKVFESLDTENHSRQRLNLLRNLMCQAGAVKIVDELENNQYFRPLSPSQCAQLICN
ncbi:ferritin-like domain-containing protein [Merismopedia glauca]|uniref:Ferritin-like domain-containing protein n=1 Tax=Merismopedia glauca CCAP 1448/3 TaxID=1296344 RepID=A0A2T1C6N4_9CYAN|nr:ferritin-like domain-containing protein [Merismopedia glauca]PSB03894.1 hypothetical protein C7B64_06290 [Merismopedia glauca CCAP 1448/3]